MTAFVVAMKCEASAVICNMEVESESTVCGMSDVRGRLAGEDVRLVVSGVGKVNAACAALAAMRDGASAIVNIGVAGGLDAKMEVGDFFEVEKTVQYDFDLVQVNKTVIGTLNGRSSPYFDCPCTGAYPPAVLATGDRFNDSKADHETITRVLSCSLRDMEGAAIAQICEKCGVPFYSMKCVSDVYGKGASTSDQYLANLEKCIAKLKLEVPGYFSRVLQTVRGKAV